MRMCYKAWQNVEKITIINCFINSEIWSQEKEIKNIHVEFDDGDTDWTVIIVDQNHYKLEPEITFATFSEVDSNIQYKWNIKWSRLCVCSAINFWRWRRKRWIIQYLCEIKKRRHR